MLKLKRDYIYRWKGISSNGFRCSGELSGSNVKMIEKKLIDKNITPLNISVKSQLSFSLINKKISKKEIVEFTQQLTLLLQTGISLQESLTIILKGYTDMKFKNLVSRIKASLETGKSLTQALQQFPKQFDKIYCCLINAGENSGTLLETLTDLSHYLESRLTLKSKIRKAMTYPIITLVTALLITIGLLLYVVPEFKNVFDEFGAKLPLLTRIIIALANSLQHDGLWIGIIITLLIIGIRYALKRPNIRIVWHRVLLHIPIVKKTIIISIVARWVRILATTSAGGMPLTQALCAAHESITNLAIKASMESLHDQVSHGQPLHQSLQNTGCFPQQACALIALGENSGTLDSMLSKVADIYSARCDNVLDGLSKLLEPVIMLLLAVLMGGLIIAMYLPIFKLGSVF